jgi:hypothetical protein
LETTLPTTGAIFDLLYEENPVIPQSLLRERVRLSAAMVLSSVFNRLPPHDTDELDTDLVDHAVDMASLRTCRVRPSLSQIDILAGP